MHKKRNAVLLLASVLLLAASAAALACGIYVNETAPAEIRNALGGVAFGLAFFAILACLFSVAILASRPRREGEIPLWKRLLFSDILLSKSRAHAVAYAGVAAALCIVTNMFELKFATTQFSLTIVSSVIAGIVMGPLLGFCAVFLGDGIGYLVNSMGYPYYWWVALACAAMALIAGFVIKLRGKFFGNLYVKLALICILTLFVCSVGINSSGMYWIGLNLYMPSDVKSAFETRFGGARSFGIYLVIRFFLLGQIWNSLANYAVLFVVTPLLARTELFSSADRL